MIISEREAKKNVADWPTYWILEKVKPERISQNNPRDRRYAGGIMVTTPSTYAAIEAVTGFAIAPNVIQLLSFLPIIFFLTA